MIRIIIADDHLMIIDGIKSLFKNDKEIRVVGEATNGNQVLALLEKQDTDLVLMDINMPEMDGIETSMQIRKRFPDVKILMLTMYNKPEFISEMINAGAMGYILKNTGKKELSEAIKTVATGKQFFSEEVKDTILSDHFKKPGEQKIEAIRLTDREKEVLRLIAEEYNTPEIAQKLFISPSTVETHRKNLLVKLNAKNLAGLVKFAMQTGLIK